MSLKLGGMEALTLEYLEREIYPGRHLGVPAPRRGQHYSWGRVGEVVMIIQDYPWGGKLG